MPKAADALAIKGAWRALERLPDRRVRLECLACGETKEVTIRRAIAAEVKCLACAAASGGDLRGKTNRTPRAPNANRDRRPATSGKRSYPWKSASVQTGPNRVRVEVVGVRTKNPLNRTSHYLYVAYLRRRAHAQIKAALEEHLAAPAEGHGHAYAVHLTRLRSGNRGRPLDSDGLSATLKGVQDAVAEFLRVDDGDTERIRWTYGQGRAKVPSIVIEIEQREARFPPPPDASLHLFEDATILGLREEWKRLQVYYRERAKAVKEARARKAAETSSHAPESAPADAPPHAPRQTSMQTSTMAAPPRKNRSTQNLRTDANSD